MNKLCHEGQSIMIFHDIGCRPPAVIRLVLVDAWLFVNLHSIYHNADGIYKRLKQGLWSFMQEFKAKIFALDRRIAVN